MKIPGQLSAEINTMSFDPAHPCPIEDLPPTAWPTINQMAGIGSVVVTWSYLELAFESLLSTLAQGDAMLIQALTEDLSADNRLKAAKRLVATWEHALVNISDEQNALFVEIRALIAWIAKNKARRNQIAHWVWMRSSDEAIFGWKNHQAPGKSKNDRPNASTKVVDLLAFSEEIGAIASRFNQAELFARQLPRWRTAPPPPLNVPGLASLLGPYRDRSIP